MKLLSEIPSEEKRLPEYVGFSQDREDENDVLNFTVDVMKLTRKKLVTTPDWPEWLAKEHEQLDQYDSQGMFGEPVHITDPSLVFDFVWTYTVKELDGRKKSRATLDGSTRHGKTRILDHTYANCPDHTGERIFYATSAVEDLVIGGADASNAFGEAPGPKQPTYLRPDIAFRTWWKSKGRRDLPKGYVIPVLRAIRESSELSVSTNLMHFLRYHS